MALGLGIIQRDYLERVVADIENCTPALFQRSAGQNILGVSPQGERGVQIERDILNFAILSAIYAWIMGMPIYQYWPSGIE